MKDSSDYALVARAIDLVRADDPRASSLEGLAAALGLGPFALQRLFTRWAGISPKRFQQALRLDAAKASLRAESDVLGAAARDTVDRQYRETVRTLAAKVG